MICRGCGKRGALIETNKPGYGRYFWHQGCLGRWQRWLGGEIVLPPAPNIRYLWESEFDFEVKVLLPGHGRLSLDHDSGLS